MYRMKAWTQIPWLFGEVTLTEKLDGHTAMIHIERVRRSRLLRATLVSDSDVVTQVPAKMDDYSGVTRRTEVWRVWAQNQTRPLSRHHDMSGLAAWVEDHARELVATLGPGVHSGTWWGYKIRRGYGLPVGDRRFSLFNTARWRYLDGSQVPGLYCVPILWQGLLTPEGLVTPETLRHEKLGMKESLAVPGYEHPQGVILYHHDGNMMFQYLFEGSKHGGSV